MQQMNVFAMEKVHDKTTERARIQSQDGVNLVYTVGLVDYFVFESEH